LEEFEHQVQQVIHKNEAVNQFKPIDEIPWDLR